MRSTISTERDSVCESAR